MELRKKIMDVDKIEEGRVTKHGNGSHVIFLRKYLGRIVHIIVPKEQKAFWLFEDDDLKQLENMVYKIEYKGMYGDARTQNLHGIMREIASHKNRFSLDNLIAIVEVLEQHDLNMKDKALLLLIKKEYRI